MSDAGTTEFLATRLHELSEEISDLEAKLERLRVERNALAHAHDAIAGLDAKEAKPKTIPLNAVVLTYQQQILLDAVPIGRTNRLTPSEINKVCPTLEGSYARTTLRRFLEQGWVHTDQNGSYWREE